MISYEEVSLLPNEPLTTEEVDRIAKLMYKNKIFFTNQCNSFELLTVFAPLIFISKVLSKKIKQSNIMFYGLMDESGPRSVNGLPIFHTIYQINTADFNRCFSRYNEIKELLGD